MKRKMLLLLVLSLLLGLFSGCTRPGTSSADPGMSAAAEASETAADIPLITPRDGDPNDVTCLGSYTADVNSAQVVARVGDRELTNGVLQAFYWAEAAAWRRGDHDEKPDFDRPLEQQACPVDETVASWQQYFLKRALNAWHGAQALILRAENEILPTEEAYKPNPKTHADNVVGKPATKFLYGYSETYRPNTQHQAYLDGIPPMLEQLAQEKGFASSAAMAEEAFGTSLESMTAWAELYNRGYMYLTFLSYDLSPANGDVEAWFAGREETYAAQGVTRTGGSYVDIRHILVADQEKADEVLAAWNKYLKVNEAAFAELAVRNSLDAGTAADGGAYRQLKKGQLPDALDAWCFDEARQPGDVTTVAAEDGVHILYFSGSTPIWFAKTRGDLTAHMQQTLIADAQERYPMKAEYASIQLGSAEAAVEPGEVLYPDIAHERFPEAPLYLQQDYPNTSFGGSPIRTHGCGITTFSMLSTYMTDSPQTPPMMCERYGNYSYGHGTDGMIFVKEPREMGYYFRERIFEPEDARAALAAGYPVVCIQHKGFWTRAGHYLLLESMDENGMVRVRDSNIANYGKLDGHKVDEFEWKHIPPACDGYWVFEKKVTAIPACSRCGDPDAVTGSPVSSYLCDKCAKAELRRNAYLNW